ncbi:MAG: type II secretion system protein GspG [Bradymonadaceae bacterium]|nr:type II secretion system protein GspG [Lujinxingiaceae bacterium]
MMKAFGKRIRNPKTSRFLAASKVSSRGMTLVEIMIVVTIMASIMGVVGFFVFGALDQANTKTAALEIGQLEGMVNSYYLMSSPHRLPDSLEELTRGPSPLTKEVRPDPWGNEYIFQKNGNRDFSISSAGPDGISGTEDDIGGKN